MYKYVFRPKGSRVYRGRYRLGDDPKIHDVALKTDKKHVAIAKLDRLVRTREEELAGLLPPKPLRDGALKPIVEHLVEHLAYLKSQGVTRKHLALTRNRILRLCGACSWRLLRDISADGFSGWAAKQTALSGVTSIPARTGRG